MKDANQTIARENYLKTIVKYLAESGKTLIPGSELGRLLGLSSGTISTMIQRLETSGLVRVEPHKGCTLTPQGQSFGLAVLRRHRLLELFLHTTLGLDWTEVHEEAELLEHALSEKLADRIDAHLGFPDRDPHGDPIPHKGQTTLPPPNLPLSSLDPGQTATVTRIQADTDLLTYTATLGLTPGATVRMGLPLAGSGLASVDIGGTPHTVALTVLEKVFYS